MIMRSKTCNQSSLISVSEEEHPWQIASELRDTISNEGALGFFVEVAQQEQEQQEEQDE